MQNLLHRAPTHSVIKPVPGAECQSDFRNAVADSSVIAQISIFNTFNADADSVPRRLVPQIIQPFRKNIRLQYVIHSRPSACIIYYEL